MRAAEQFISATQRFVKHAERPQVRPKSPKLRSNQNRQNERTHHRRTGKLTSNRQPVNWVRVRTNPHDKKLKSILKVDGHNGKRAGDTARTADLKMRETCPKNANRSVKFNFHAMLRRFASELSNPFEGIVYDDRMIPVRQEERSPGRLMAKARRQRKAAELLCAPKPLEKNEPLYRIPTVPCFPMLPPTSTAFVPSRENIRLLTLLHRIECRQYRCCKNKRIPRAVKGGIPHNLAILGTCDKADSPPSLVIINEAPQVTITMVSLSDLPDECLVLPFMLEEQPQQHGRRQGGLMLNESFEEWLDSARIKTGSPKHTSKIRECRTIE